MNNEMVCCQGLECGGKSPFEIIMLGWQDGLTEGMAKCRICRRAYHFEMQSWDDEQDVRVFGFRQIGQAGYDALALFDARPDLASEKVDEGLRLVRDALATSYERILYVASSDLSKEIIVGRILDFVAWRRMLRF